MARLLRRLFNSLAAASLLLFVATCALAVRSRWVHDIVQRTWAGRASRTTRALQLESESGVLVLDWHRVQIGSDKDFESYVSRFPARAEWRRHDTVRDVLPAQWQRSRTGTGGDSLWSRLGFVYEHYSARRRAPGGVDLRSDTRLALPRWLGVIYVGGSHVKPGWDESAWYVTVPHSLAALIFLVPPVAWLVPRLRRRRRRLARRCVACGYDLRATPDKGGTLLQRCPECGTQAAGMKPPRSATETRKRRPVPSQS
jgi:hypothetical protein